MSKNEQKKPWQVIKKRLFRILKVFLLTCILLISVVFIGLQLPGVQTYLVKKVSAELSERLGQPVTIDWVSIRWLDRAALGGIQLLDHEDNLLIGVKDLEVDFDLIEIIKTKEFSVNEVILRGAEVNLIRNAPDGSFNIDWFIYNIDSLSPPPSEKPKVTKKSKPFSIPRAKLIDSKFTMDDIIRGYTDPGFDPNHFTLENIQADLNNLTFNADTFSVAIKNLSCRDQKTQLPVHNLTTYYRLSNKAMEFYDLDFRVGNSHIKDELVFKFDSQLDLGYFIDKVTVISRMRGSQVDLDDLKLFAPELNSINDYYIISGDFEGTVKRFDFDDFNIAFGNQSTAKGSVSFFGLPDISQTFTDLKLQQARIHSNDLEQYITDATYEGLEQFGLVNFKANFLGFLNDFVADGEFDTPLGYINSDVNVKISDQPGESYYSGSITTKDFQLGNYSQLNILGNVDMSGRIEGRGFTVEDADFEFDGQIDRIGINQYDYRGITANGAFAKEFFRR